MVYTHVRRYAADPLSGTVPTRRQLAVDEVVTGGGPYSWGHSTVCYDLNAMVMQQLWV